MLIIVYNEPTNKEFSKICNILLLIIILKTKFVYYQILNLNIDFL